MRTTQVIAIALVAVGFAGCCKKGESTGSTGDPGPTTTAAPPPATTTAATPPSDEKRFAGVYSSNWGQTTFDEVGSLVTAKYPRGTLSCTAASDVLSCTWFEGAMTGKARLVRQANGDLKGTWGNGASETNGGAWVFTRTASAPATGGAIVFAGTYNSNWGATNFEQNGSSVTAKYPRGTLSCLANGPTLTCDWFEGASRGKAILVRNADGSLSGTWGNGSSATNGGPWRFTPKP